MYRKHTGAGDTGLTMPEVDQRVLDIVGVH